MEITKDLEKSLEGLTEEELKRALRRLHRAKAEEEKNPKLIPVDVKIESATLDKLKRNALRYVMPKRQEKESGRESYEGHTSLTDKFGYMPLLDRLLQMQRGGESLAQLRTHMAEYNLEMRKELEKASKLKTDDWPLALNTYTPDIAEIQQMQKDAQMRVAAKVKARAEEQYRAKAFNLLEQRLQDKPNNTPQNQPEGPQA